MLSGAVVDLEDPQVGDIHLSDIALGLSRVARWNGQTVGREAFSVAQHSALVWYLFVLHNKNASDIAQRSALLHDAAEYVIGDLIAPFKATIGGDYNNVEHRILDCIYHAMHISVPLPSPIHNAIKISDRTAARLEATTLAGFEPNDAEKFFPLSGKIPEDDANIHILLNPLPSYLAKELFETIYKTLKLPLTMFVTS